MNSNQEKEVFHCARCNKEMVAPDGYNPLEEELWLLLEDAEMNGDEKWRRVNLCLHCMAVLVSSWIAEYGKSFDIPKDNIALAKSFADYLGLESEEDDNSCNSE